MAKFPVVPSLAGHQSHAARHLQSTPRPSPGLRGARKHFAARGFGGRGDVRVVAREDRSIDKLRTPRCGNGPCDERHTSKINKFFSVIL